MFTRVTERRWLPDGSWATLCIERHIGERDVVIAYEIHNLPDGTPCERYWTPQTGLVIRS